jgi:protein SCO1
MPERSRTTVGPTFNLDPNSPAVSNPSLVRTFVASGMVVVLGIALLFLATNGGQGFTTESIRRSEVSQKPQQIPNFNLLRSDGKDVFMQTLLRNDNKLWIVDFVYTRCQTICKVLGTGYQQLQAEILRNGLQNKIGLLSISFDVANDNQQALKNYEKRMAVNSEVWQIVALKSMKDRQRLLDTFGIVVIPAPLGEFEHNAALHIVTSDAMLVEILGYENLPKVIEQVVSRSNQTRLAK